LVTTHVERSIEVAVPVRTAYDQWTRFEEFPRFMSGVEEVRQVGDALTHWVAHIAGIRREWDAEIIEQVPDQKVAWAATTGATNAGTVFFDDVGAARTRVRLTLEFEPEGVLERIGDVLDVVDRQAVADLDRFKEFIEGRGSATGGWRGTIEDGDVVSDGTDARTGAGETADDVPGDVVAVGPTGSTESTLTTEHGGAPSATPSVDDSTLGHSGDPIALDPDAGRGAAGTSGPTADAASSSQTGVAGFGTDTGLSSDDPNSGVVTGSPGAHAAGRAGTGTDDGERTGVAAGAASSSAAGVAGFGTDTGLSSDDPNSGTVTGNPGASTGSGGRHEARSDEPWAAGGSGPGENRGVRGAGQEGVVRRNFADENVSSDDVVARDFANRDISGGGVVERDFANRDVTERDIADRGIEGHRGAPAPQPTGLNTLDTPGTADEVGGGLDPLDPRAGTADDPDNPIRPSV
jgi:carbon monoxide dehydrogenase subunit G